MLKMTRVIFVGFALVVLISPSVASSQMTCIGQVLYGSLDSAVGDCTFVTGTKEGQKILEVCHGGDRCEVKAIVKGDLIERVISVSKVGEK
jgi:hypothetical protein